MEEAAERLAEALAAPGAPDLADAAYTLQVGRTVFRHRQVLVCRDREEAAAALGISLRTANRHWAYAKAWLYRRMSERDAAGP